MFGALVLRSLNTVYSSAKLIWRNLKEDATTYEQKRKLFKPFSLTLECLLAFRKKPQITKSTADMHSRSVTRQGSYLKSDDTQGAQAEYYEKHSIFGRFKTSTIYFLGIVVGLVTTTPETKSSNVTPM